MAKSGTTPLLLMVVAVLVVVALFIAARGWKADDRIVDPDAPDVEEGVISRVPATPVSLIPPPPGVDPAYARPLPLPGPGADTQPRLAVERVQSDGVDDASTPMPPPGVFAVNNPRQGFAAGGHGGPGPVPTLAATDDGGMPDWLPPAGSASITAAAPTAAPGLPAPTSAADPAAWITDEPRASTIRAAPTPSAAAPVPVPPPELPTPPTASYAVPPLLPPTTASAASTTPRSPFPPTSPAVETGSTASARPTANLTPFRPNPPPAPSAPSAAAATVAGGAKEYVVRPGDTLSGIAGAELGNEGRWREIYQANRAKIADPNWLSVGVRLVLPPRAAPSPPAVPAAALAAASTAGNARPAAGAPGRARVLKAGETLRMVAKEEYGDENKATLIVDANAAVLQKAGRPQAGMTLVIPPAR